MEGSSSHLTVVVGGSRLADELRRCLVQRGVQHVGIAAHLRGLRSSLVTGDYDCMIVCIALDAATLQRHGEGLRRLLEDHACHAMTEVRSIGVLTDLGLTAEAATLGCDVFVADTGHAVEIASWLADEAARLSRPGQVSAGRPLSWRFGGCGLPDLVTDGMGPDAPVTDPESPE